MNQAFYGLFQWIVVVSIPDIWIQIIRHNYPRI
jgi:hypothetical protein